MMREMCARTIEREHGDEQTVAIRKIGTTRSTRDEIESELMRVKHYMYFIICIKSINNQCVCHSTH